MLTTKRTKEQVEMLDYSKTILQKVRFDRKLFWKEYKKSLNYLNDEDAAILRGWVKNQFFSKLN
jgi:hypothetical protein